MKLKEFPGSIIQSLKLLKIKKNELGIGAIESDMSIIISLTSIPNRLNSLHLVIRSLLNQNRTFEKVVLWLHTSLKEKIPPKLASLQSPRFEIRYSEVDSSHLKLVESLHFYKDHFIVTCDDDLMYPKNWLQRLLEQHHKHPNAIVAHVCRVFQFKADGNLAPYHEWEYEEPGCGSKLTLALGYGGVLYPPQSLHSDTTNENLYMKLAPKNDDLWFKVMSLKQQTPVINTRHPKPKPVPIAFTQKYSLKRSNVHGGANIQQWLNLVKHFKVNLFNTEK